MALAVLASALAAPAHAAEDGARVEALRQRLAEREAEIAALKASLAQLQSQLEAGTAAAPAPPPTRAATVPAASDIDDELDRALESSLVRQGGSVLRPGTVELEPEASYFYHEPRGSGRRDGFGLAMTGRVGLPAAMQAELRAPYVVSDHWSGVGESSGWGDVQLALIKEFVSGDERTPSLLGFAQWRAPTGDVKRLPPTGNGQHAIALGLTTVKRQDPVVLFGSLYYTVNLGHARLRDDTRFDAGDTLGGRLGAYLAATPDTSLYLGLAFDSNAADRLDGERLDRSSRLRSVVELGTTTVIGRGRFLNVTGGIGITRDAPKFSLTVSLPVRF